MHKFFFPLKDRIGLPLSIGKRMPILINLNVMLIAYFILATVTRFKADPKAMLPLLVAVNATSVIFLVSLAFIRFRRYMVASVISVSGILLDTLWIGLFIPFKSEGDLYRLAVYIIVSCIVNSMLAINLKQIIAYAVAAFLVFAGVAVIVYAPLIGGFQGEFRTSFVTLTLVYLPSNIVIYFTGKLSSDLVKLVENELAINRTKTLALDDLIKNAKGSLEIGKTLLDASAESRRRSLGIRESLGKLRVSSQGMSNDSRCTDETNKDVAEYTRVMQQSVGNQNSFLRQTNASISEIMAKIQNIAQLAGQKKTIMDAVLGKIEMQAQEIQRINDSFDKIRLSSADVLAVAGGILDISEKTNMLAMNASIEAAHAGSAGKGFAVISGEIRKLSQETQSSTKSIGEALSRNDATVTEVSTIVLAYTKHIASVVNDVRDTFYAIEEIINGLGDVSRSTNDLTSATENLVKVARDTETAVNSVTEKIGESSESAAHISSFACSLEEMIGAVEADFSAIEGVLEKVADVGQRNILNIQTLEQEMDRITRS